MTFLNKIENLTIIGSGISSSFTLLNILERIEKDENSEKVAITLIDKYPEFFCGIPYGSRSGYAVLLITSLENFLPEPELEKFIIWLNKNKDWLLQEFKKEGGDLSQKWLENHQEEINVNKWKNIFIPRRFFGCYIEEKLNTLITTLKEKGLLSINLVKGEVIDVVNIDQNYTVALDDGSTIFTEKVILSIGSLPTRSLWKHKNIIEENNLLFINQPYAPSLNSNIDHITKYIKDRKEKPTNVLVIGANASGLEMIYKLNDYPEINAGIRSFKFLSTQGLLPDSEIDVERQKHFTPKHLESLSDFPVLTAEEIAHATYKDLEVAEIEKLGAASTVGIISSAFGNLLNKLDTNELKSFACFHGNEIGRRQRCAGVHYSKTIESLKEKNKFEHIAGRFMGMKKESNDKFYVDYLDTATQKQHISTTPTHIVINCIGSMNLSDENIPELIKNLIQKKYVKPNDSQIGFEVNENLEAKTNLHIVGPLLAGNIIENKAVWHVEHCGRIVWLSQVLAEKIYQNWKHKRYTTNPEFRISYLNNKEHINAYNSRVKNDWQGSPYYYYEYFAHHQKEGYEIISFELYDDGIPLALMPIIKRSIPNTDGTFFDCISPYGYNGPLFKAGVNKQVIVKFWSFVDDWYRNNNIISEFIRFDLNGNNTYYSSFIKSTLVNVYGCLLSNFELQWDNFHAKVRNNYRKAVNHNLRFEIFSAHQIEAVHIESFYAIYKETMKRNNATKELYFSIDYFKNLINAHNSTFLLAFAYIDEKAISTELIISYKDFMHAFLGGTLSDYYSYRPNDFLRVEIIKWGILNEKRKYILGGGVIDNDGLYKSKKAFFPNDIDITFYTGRKIINHKIYDELTENKEKSIKNDGFFPAYR